MMSDRENKLAADKLMVEAAKFLPGNWKLSGRFADSHWQTLLDGDGGTSLFIDSSKAGRLFVSGGWPCSKAGHPYQPRYKDKISVGSTRPPEAIASEISRRFLPEYLDEYAKQAGLAAESDESDSKRTALVDRLQSIIGGKVARNNEYTIELSGWGNEIEATAGHEVNIKLHYLDTKRAEKILRAVKRILGD